MSDEAQAPTIDGIARTARPSPPLPAEAGAAGADPKRPLDARQR